jgi:hypothetical protein
VSNNGNVDADGEAMSWRQIKLKTTASASTRLPAATHPSLARTRRPTCVVGTVFL